MSDEKFGPSFNELSQDEMDFVTGAAGTPQPRITPTISAISAASSYGCASAGASFLISAFSGLVSYTKECI